MHLSRGWGGPILDVNYKIVFYPGTTYANDGSETIEDSVSQYYNRKGTTISVWTGVYCQGSQAKLANGYNQPSTAFWDNNTDSHNAPDTETFDCH